MNCIDFILSQIGKNLVEISAVFIALCALIFSMRESRLNRKHQKMTVTPHLDIHKSISYPMQFLEILIKNEGLGPAFITKTQLLYEEKKIDLIDIGVHMREIVDESILNIFTHDEETILKDGNEIKYLCIQFNNSKKLSEDEIIKLNARIRVEVNYRSMYNEEFIAKG